MHFIGFAHKFIHTDPEVIVQMLSKVCLFPIIYHGNPFAHKFIHKEIYATESDLQPWALTQLLFLQVINVLTSSRELVDLIKNVDIVFHSVPAAGSSKSMLNTLYRFVPSIREQLQVSLHYKDDKGICVFLQPVLIFLMY